MGRLAAPAEVETISALPLATDNVVAVRLTFSVMIAKLGFFFKRAIVSSDSNPGSFGLIRRRNQTK